MRTIPFFFDSFPRSRRPDYPRHRGDLRTRVVIVGGGLTGCACASAFATACIRTVLLEADRIGASATAASAGLLRQDFDATFQETSSRHGLRATRHLWQAMRRASLELAATMRRLGIRCDLTPQDLVVFSANDPLAARRLRREYEARRAAGLDVSWLNRPALTRDTDLTADAGVRVEGQAFDPYRGCVGLAAAATARGAIIHERSPVRRVRAGRKSIAVRTDGGTITADAVIVATGGAIDDLQALRRHFVPRQSYAVVTEPMPAAVRRTVGRRAAALRDSRTPPHVLRWLKEERVYFSGADQPPVAMRLRERTLVQRAGQLMYELSTVYPGISGLRADWAWDLVHYRSPDGLPVIGPHRNFPRHLLALGFGRHGAGVSWLAARVLLRSFLGEPAKGDELFGFARIL